ncbi:MAG: hypothetical protein APF81_24125 [Desulfosporosinus sp. BRH_c37]|nr:MAG: hypothetical protein APF81_24125 [Desulfosporosinus sp. BRH_c37]
MDTVCRLAKALDVPLSCLFTDESDPVIQAPYKSANDFQHLFKKKENLSYLHTLQKAQMAGITPDLLDELIDLIIRIRMNPFSK